MTAGGHVTEHDVLATQDRVAMIWSDILSKPYIAPNDNFFELGGDSLQMFDMISRVQRELQIDVDMGLLFEDASLAGFSKSIEQTRVTIGSAAGFGT